MTDDELKTIEARAETALAYGDVTGYRAVCANDVPVLVGEVRRLLTINGAVAGENIRLRASIDVLWRQLNRDQKTWADEDLQQDGLPEVEVGYRQA